MENTKVTQNEYTFYKSHRDDVFYIFVESEIMDMTLSDKLYNLRGMLEELKKNPQGAIETLEHLVLVAEEEARSKGYCPRCGEPMTIYMPNYTPGVCDTCGYSEDE